MLWRFALEERGQDLVEYGLLLGIVTAALIVMWPVLPARIGAAFVTWGSQTNGIWEPSPPGP